MKTSKKASSNTQKKKPSRFPVGVRFDRNNVIQVEEAIELKEVDHCYHVNQHHPNSPTKIQIEGLPKTMKLRIINWIREGKIFIDKE